MAIVRNLATVKTTAGITKSATSIPVNRTNVFGAAQNPLDNPFYVTIMPASGSEPANTTNSEIALVTGISGSNLIVTRGQRSTTARAFSAGAIVTMGIYAEDAVLLGGGGTTASTTAYRKKLVDKDGNTIIPIMGDIGPVYTARLSSASGGIARYEFTPDTPVENSRVYAVKFPAPTVNNATIILGDGVSSGSILVPPVAATDTPNYELLDTTMINDTEPLLLMYNGVQWVCLNQKRKVATADLENKAVKSAKIDWTTFKPYWKTVAKSTSSNVTIPAGYRLYRVRLIGNKTSTNTWGVIGCSQATGTTWIYVQGMTNGTWVAAERSLAASSDKAVMDGARSYTAPGVQTWDITISKQTTTGTECMVTWETSTTGSLTFNTGRSIFNVTSGTADMNLYCELSSALWSVEAFVDN